MAPISTLLMPSLGPASGMLGAGTKVGGRRGVTGDGRERLDRILAPDVVQVWAERDLYGAVDRIMDYEVSGPDRRLLGDAGELSWLPVAGSGGQDQERLA